MSKAMKRRIFAGVVCEQYCYSVPDSVKDPDNYEKKPRFKNNEERAEFNRKLAWTRHARSFNANFGPTSLYSTLTCDVQHELYDFKEAKRVAKNYMRRLFRRYPNSRMRMYTGRGGSTYRIHFHMVSEGVPEDIIKKQWKMGDIKRCDNLRENNRYNGMDYGQDYTGLANYLIAHWTEEVGGHRYMQMGKFKEPEKEEITECKRKYDLNHPPRAPKGYTLREAEANSYGFIRFRYIALPKKKNKQEKREKTYHISKIEGSEKSFTKYVYEFR